MGVLALVFLKRGTDERVSVPDKYRGLEWTVAHSDKEAGVNILRNHKGPKSECK